MVRKRVQKSSERSPQPQESAIAPVGARSHSPSSHTQRDMETQEIQQHKHEATTLEIQAKYGTITPQGQERLTFLQAKMADYTQRKLDFANRVYQHMYNSSGGNSSVTPSERKIAPPIQAKLTIGQPGDKYEQEADRVAAQVVKQIHAPTTQRQALPEDEQQKKPAIGSIQRQSMPEDEELQMKPSGAGMTAPQDLETSIQQARGSGQPLADGIKQPMQQAFGADFSGVKIHTDAQSHQLNQSIQARAFTTGQDIFFRQGEYNPGSRGGQELLAHELTHVVQQKPLSYNISRMVQRQIDFGAGVKGNKRQKEIEQLAQEIKQEIGGYTLTKKQIIDKLTEIDKQQGLISRAEAKKELMTTLGVSEKEGKPKEDLAQAYKQDQIQRYLTLLGHLGGEKKDKDQVSGGHLFSAMQQKWNKSLKIVKQEGDTSGVWTLMWTLDNRKPKQSTMFPQGWNENDLRDQLLNSNVVGDSLELPSKIMIEKKGDTFFPKIN